MLFRPPTKHKAMLINNFIVHIDRDYTDVDHLEGAVAEILHDRPARGQVAGAIHKYGPGVWVFARHLSNCTGWRNLCDSRSKMQQPQNITLRLLDNANGQAVVGTIQLLQCHVISLKYRTVTDPNGPTIRIEEVLVVLPTSFSHS